MFTTVSGFLESWKFESDGTSKLLAALTDASLAQAVTPVGRTLGRLAWHITTTIPEMRDNIVNGAFGAKFSASKNTLIIANVLVPLNRGGLRANHAYTLGLEYGF